jgi:hypothetical protein
MLWEYLTSPGDPDALMAGPRPKGPFRRCAGRNVYGIVGRRGIALDITWQNVLLAGAGVVGTTALTLLVKRFADWLSERRSQLLVEVEVNEMFKGERVANGMKELMEGAIPPSFPLEERKKLPFVSYDIYTRFFSCEKYTKVSITNATQKKIAGLTLSIDTPGSELAQIGEGGELSVVQGGTPLPLGDLQPKRKLVVSVLTSRLFTTATDQAIRERFLFSSDEHIRTRYVFPSPGHIAFRDKMRRTAQLAIMWLVLGACFMMGFLIFGLKP